MSRRLLADFLSIGTGGEAEVQIVTDVAELRPAGGEIVLGRGTNVLASDRGVDRRVIVMRNSFIKVRDDRIYAGAGAALPAVVRAAAESGLTGLEWACGIPGSVGGGVIMNAGAYGGQLGDRLTRVEVLTDGEIVSVPARDLEFVYRSVSGLPQGIITAAEFGLRSGEVGAIYAKMREYAESRRLAQPGGRTFGSAFARVDGRSAGWYIERAGLKGRRAGGAYISEKHANFIVNDGGATAADVRELLDVMKLTVYARFGVRLTEEVRYIGEF